jgi:hypothetical protein
MKIALSLLSTLLVVTVYSMDCERVLFLSKPLECNSFVKKEKRVEKRLVKDLLKGKIDTSNSRSNYNFIKKNSICSDELRSIQDYSNFNYRVYSRAQREGTENTILEEFKKGICLISIEISKIAYYQGPVFRGMDLPPAVAAEYLKIGNVFTERSFLSTDKNLSVAIGFSRANDAERVSIVLNFKGPVGHSISYLSLNPLEDEVLIDWGKQFLVKDVEAVQMEGFIYHLVTLENYE